MSKVSVFDHAWIDLVFEGRNQSYGAYQLRKQDSRTMLLALLSGIALMGAIVTVPVLINYFRPDLPPVPKEYTLPGTDVIPVDLDPIVETKKPEPITTKGPTAPPPVNLTPTQEFKPLAPTSGPVEPVLPTSQLTNPGPETTPGNPLGQPGGITGGQPGGTGTTPTNTMGTGPGTGLATTATVDVMPAFPGGMDAFYELVGKKFNTPDMDTARTMKVFVYFVVEADGSMSSIKVTRDPGHGLGNEAIRVLKSIKTKWKPGQIKGVNVRTAYNLPITVNIK